jgi:hypothetical protein
MQQLNACYVESKVDLQAIVDEARATGKLFPFILRDIGYTLHFTFFDIGKPSWPLEVVHELLEDGVHGLCMAPFESIVLHGKAQDYFKKVPEICNLLAHFQRDKVVRSMIVLYGQNTYHLTERPDLLRTYFRYCCSSNDNFIENYNALVEGGLPSTVTITEADVAKSSSIVVIKHYMMQTKLQALDPEHHKPDSEREGEVRIEEQKAQTKSAILDRNTELKPWLIGYYKRLARMETTNAR